MVCQHVDLLDDAQRITALRGRLPASMRWLASDERLHGPSGRWTQVCSPRFVSGWKPLKQVHNAAHSRVGLPGQHVVQAAPAQARKPDGTELYESLRKRLFEFEAAGTRRTSSAQERTLYAVLHTALAECAAHQDTRSREHAIAGAANWFAKGLARLRYVPCLAVTGRVGICVQY